MRSGEPTLLYLITNAQLLALEQRRTGDLRLELRGPQRPAASFLRLSSSTKVTEHIRIAEGLWRQRSAGLGPQLGAEC